MDSMNHKREAAMRRTIRNLSLIAGSFIFSLGGGVLGYLGAWAAAAGGAQGNEDAGLVYFILLCPPSFLVGGTMGAAAGTTIMQKALRQRSSFWRALLGATVGLLIGVLPTALCLWALFAVGVWLDGWWPFFLAIAIVCATIVAGAVIGSGWKAKPANPGTKEGVPPALD
jgi:hypothetical protein